MGLGSKTQTIYNKDGSVETRPADRFKVARYPLGYYVIDTEQKGNAACPDGAIVFTTDPAPATDAIDDLKQLKGVAQTEAARLNKTTTTSSKKGA